MEETKPFVISKEVVKIAFERVKANKGTYGIDEQTIADFEENLKNNLTYLINAEVMREQGNATRKEVLEIPEDVLKEAIINRYMSSSVF